MEDTNTGKQAVTGPEGDAPVTGEVPAGESAALENPATDAGGESAGDVPGPAGAAPDAQAQISELTDRLLRTMADFDNFRKRTQKERIGMQDDGLRGAIEKLLPVIDNFERAMQNAPGADDPFAVGIQMIFKQLIGTFNEMGVCEIPALGESFNPEVHFAVSHTDDEGYGENQVIDVLQKGYKYKEKVIRPSMVRVAN